MKKMEYFDKLSKDEYLLKTNVGVVEDVDWNKYKPKRGGIIIYKIQKGKLEFYMGRDRKYKEYTDFGGTINYRKENGLQGGIREFEEESLGVFEEIKEEQIKKSTIVVSENSFIIFYQNCEERYKNYFNENRNKNTEVDSVKRFYEQEFIDLVYNQKSLLYMRVRNLLLTDNAILKIMTNIKAKDFCTDLTHNYLSSEILDWIYHNYDDLPRSRKNIVQYIEDNYPENIPDDFNVNELISLHRSNPFFSKYIIAPRSLIKLTSFQDFIISSFRDLLNSFSSPTSTRHYVNRVFLEQYIFELSNEEYPLSKIHDSITYLISHGWIKLNPSDSTSITLYLPLLQKSR